METISLSTMRGGRSGRTTRAWRPEVPNRLFPRWLADSFAPVAFWLDFGI
jgi:hypothetical protein